MKVEPLILGFKKNLSCVPNTKLYLSTITLGLLNGCSGVQLMNDVQHEANDIIKDTNRVATQGSTLTRHNTDAEVLDDYFLVDKPFQMSERDQIPDYFNNHFSFNQPTPISLRELFDYITKEYAIKIDVTNDALVYINGSTSADKEVADSTKVGAEQSTKQSTTNDSTSLSNDSVMSSTAPVAGAKVSGLVTTANIKDLNNDYSVFGRRSPGDASRLTVEKFTFQYEGTLAGALDYITQKYGVSWKFHENSIQVFRTEFKTYTFDGSNSQIGLSTTMNSSVSGDNGSTGMNTTSSLKTNSLYDEVQKAITQLLSPNLGTMTMNTNTGTITVDDIPSVQAKVKLYLDRMNAIVNKRLFFKVQVVQLKSDETGNYGVNLDALYGGSDRFSMELSSLAASTASSGAQVSLGLVNSNSKWSGSKSVIDLLHEVNKTTTDRKFTFTTQNGKPVPFQNIEREAYIKSLNIETSTDDDGNESTDADMEISEVLPGISINLLPKINSHNDINVEVSLNLDTLNDITEFSAGDGAVVAQLPDQTQQSVSQSVRIRSGQTMMLSSYEEAGHASDTQSIDGESDWAIGGNKSGERNKVMTLILLTPYIMAD